MRKVSFILSILIGFVMMWGAIGSSDLGLISNTVLVTRSGLGLFLMWIGYAGLSVSRG